MSPRTGRPKINNPLNVDIKVRIDKPTNDRLIKYCEEHKVSRTEVIRKGINKVLDEK